MFVLHDEGWRGRHPPKAAYDENSVWFRVQTFLSSNRYSACPLFPL